MSKIFCLLDRSKISKCYLERGQAFLQACVHCTYYQEKHKKTKWLQEVKHRRQKEADEDHKNKEALDKGVVRLSLEPLPAIKKSKAKLPKEKKVIDGQTGKLRRLRFDTDYWRRNRFQAKLCLICRRLCEEHGWKYKNRKEGPPSGKQIALGMTISEILKQPEMKGFRSSNPRTLKAWRSEHCISCKKENPAQTIYVGRPKKVKSDVKVRI